MSNPHNILSQTKVVLWMVGLEVGPALGAVGAKVVGAAVGPTEGVACSSRRNWFGRGFDSRRNWFRARKSNTSVEFNPDAEIVVFALACKYTGATDKKTNCILVIVQCNINHDKIYSMCAIIIKK